MENQRITKKQRRLNKFQILLASAFIAGSAISADYIKNRLSSEVSETVSDPKDANFSDYALNSDIIYRR